MIGTGSGSEIRLEMKRRASGRGLLALSLLLVGAVLACTVPGATPAPNSGIGTAAQPAAAGHRIGASRLPTGPGPCPDRTPTPSRSASPTAAPTPDLAARCARLTAELDLAQQVGQLFMAAIPSDGASAANERALRRSAVGSVILLGNTTSGADAVAAVIRAARRAAGTQQGVRTLLAADQEGGQVQRLRGEGFSRMPAAHRAGRARRTPS